MLAPRASSAFVCLGCELRLAQPRPRLSALVRRPSHASFSASSRRHQDADQAEPAAEPVPATHDVWLTNDATPTTIGIQRRRGKTVTTAKLGGLTQLGDDAGILVIREARGAKKPAAEPEEHALLEAPDIVGSLEQEQAATPETLYDQIESLRPKPDADADPFGPHYVSQTTFVQLAKTLTAGFTIHQLSQFYQTAVDLQEIDELEHGVKASVDEAKRVLRRTNWHPGTTSLDTRLPGMRQDPNRRPRRTFTNKRLLVENIMKRAWKLVRLDEIETPGEVELALRPWQLAVLNAGDNGTSLDTIGRARKVKLEVHWKHGVVRITADKHTAEYAANDVEAVLRKVETATLDLRPWMPRMADGIMVGGRTLAGLYSQQHFDMVASMTRASVQRLNNDELAVWALDKASLDEAMRALISMLPLKATAVRTIDHRKLSLLEKRTYQLPPLDDVASLDYMFRTPGLGRWTVPVDRPLTGGGPENGGGAVEEFPKIDRRTSRLVVRILETLMEAAHESPNPATRPKEPEESKHWPWKAEYKLAAEFGHVLFPFKSTTMLGSAQSALAKNTKAPFWPAIPGLANLLSSDAFMTTAHAKTPTLLYNFIPAPNQDGFKPSQTFPSLHVQLRTSYDGRNATIHKISLRFQERVHDVLIPDKASDVRFYRYARLRLPRGFQDKNLTEWIETVRANIESGDRLTAPPLNIEVPRWLLSGYDDNAKGTRTVKYLFSDIQFRQTVTARFLDIPASYSTVQSGKLGAKGGRLIAYYENDTGVSNDFMLRNERALKTFVRRCMLLVDHITRAGSKVTVPVSKLLNPRKEDSERRLRRAIVREVGESNEDEDADERGAAELEELD